MITTDIITLAFSGDGLTTSFDVRIEGIPIAPDGASHFVVSRKDADGEIEVLRYGVDYSYVAHIVNGFSNSLTLTLNEPLPAGASVIVLRTTPIFSISYYPENKTPPKQVEADFDHIIKILQEQGHLVKKLREDLDAEVVAREEADAALERAIEEEARVREEADAALGRRIDQETDGFDEVLKECRGILEEMREAQEAISDLSHGDLGGPVETIYFTSDGVAASYTIPRPKIGRNILLMAFEASSRRKIHFAERTPSDGSIILELAGPLPAGTRFGVVFLRSVNAGDGEAVNTEYEHIQNEPSDTWVVNHDLAADYPRVLIRDSDGSVTVGGEDWSRASEKIVTLTFSEPISGKAVLSV